MWKIGDYLIFIKNGRIDSTEEFGFEIGKKYKILIKTDDGGDDRGHEKEFFDVNDFSYQVINGQGDLWWIEIDSFKLARNIHSNKEIDWLDRVQENFKYE